MWSNPPKIDADDLRMDEAKKVEELANVIGQFSVLEARNRGFKSPAHMATALITAAAKMAGALAALSKSTKARQDLAGNLALSFRDAIMTYANDVDDDADLQDLMKAMPWSKMDWNKIKKED